MVSIWFVYASYMLSIWCRYGADMVRICFLYWVSELEVDEFLVVAAEEDAGDEEEGVEEIAKPAAAEESLAVL